jgi:hypothetical protein
MEVLPILFSLVIVGGIVYLFVRQNRERTTNAPLRAEIQAQVRLSTPLDHVSILGTGGFGGTKGQWIRFKGPKRLVVGADAFMISMPQALREFAFSGRESSIALSQAPSRLTQRDWIIITGQAGDRQVQLAITRKENLPEIWQALAGTGAAPVALSGRLVASWLVVWKIKVVIFQISAGSESRSGSRLAGPSSSFMVPGPAGGRARRVVSAVSSGGAGCAGFPGDRAIGASPVHRS